MIAYIVTLSLLILTIILVRVVFRKKASARVVYALWLAVAVRLCLPMSFISVDLPKIPVLDGIGVVEESTKQHGEDPSVLQGDWQTDKAAEENPVPDGDSDKYPVVEDSVAVEEPLPIVPGGALEDGGALEEPYVPSESEVVSPVVPDVEESPMLPVKNEVISTDVIVDEPSPIVPESPEVSDSSIRSDTSSVNVPAILNAVWLAGSAVMLAFFAVTRIVFNIRLRKDRKQWGKVGGTRVYVTEKVASPCVAGIIPAIYVTPAAAENSDALDYILKHEHCHIRHGDHVWALLRCAALSIHWYNPLVWAAVILSMRDAELACDESVALKLDAQKRIDYARIIVEMIPVKKSYSVGFGNEPLKERIEMLTSKRKNAILAAILAVAMATASVGCAFVKGTDEVDETDPVVGTVVGSKSETESETELETELKTETETAIKTESETETEKEITADEETEEAPSEEEIPDAEESQTTPPETSGAEATETTAPPKKPETEDDTDPEDTPAEVKPAKPINTITGADDFKYEIVECNEGYNSSNDELLKQYKETLTADSPSSVSIIRIDTFEDAEKMISIDKSFIEKYDEEYFENDSLILIYNRHSCESFEDRYSDFAFDGKTFSFNLETYLPPIWTSLIELTYCYLEIDGKLPENIEYKVEQKYVEEVVKEPEPTPPEVTAETFAPKTTTFDTLEPANFKKIADYEINGKYDKLFPNTYVIETHYAARDICSKDDNGVFKQYIGKYDEEFFENNTLIVIINMHYCGAEWTYFEKPTFDGKTFGCELNIVHELCGHEAFHYSALVVEVNGILPRGTVFSVKVAESVYGYPTQQVVTPETFAPTSWKTTSSIFYLDSIAEYEFNKNNQEDIYRQGPNVYVIDTYKEALEIKDANKYEGIFPGYFGKILEQYDASFFKDKSLVIVVEYAPYLGHKSEFSTPVFDGKTFSCEVEIHDVNGGGLAAIEFHANVIEINGRLPEDVEMNVTRK